MAGEEPQQRLIQDERRIPDRRQHDRRVTPSIIASSLLQRLSWQGLMVGTLIALGVQVTLFVLGMAIGIYTPPAVGSLTTRIGLWEIVMTAGSLFPAGYVGARTAAVPSRKDSALHGIIIWALTIVAAPSLGGRIGVASAFAIPADIPSALWAFTALMAGLAAASFSAWIAAPHVNVYPRREPPTLEKIN